MVAHRCVERLVQRRPRQSFDQSYYRVFKKPSSVPNPSTLFTFMEERADGINSFRFSCRAICFRHRAELGQLHSETIPDSTTRMVPMMVSPTAMGKYTR